MEERRQQEETKKRAAIVAVNDISFPALSGGGSSSSAGGGWGSEAPAAIKPAPPAISYSDRLKTPTSAPISRAGGGAGTSIRDQAAELSVFRHRPVPQFGTSRSSREDTYYDDGATGGDDRVDNDGWNVIDKRKTPVTKSKINYGVDLTDEDYGDCEEPNSSW